MRSFLGVPVRIGDRVFGNLYLTDKIDAGEFTAEDEDFTIALASVAGMVIENARLYDESQAKAVSLERANREIERLAVIEDRERIGRELHDTIVQRIFSSGMTLQAVAQACEDTRPDVAKRINEVIDDLDQTIRQIRTAIFSLDTASDTTSDVRLSLLRVVAEASRLLDFEPELSIEGPVDALVPHAVRDDAVSVLREALTNVVRHAEATSVRVRVVADADSLSLEITDNGVGPDEHASGGRGVLNMRQRASRRGGSHAIRREDNRTVVWWQVPLP
jgi:signal transduction histidine kinase